MHRFTTTTVLLGLTLSLPVSAQTPAQAACTLVTADGHSYAAAMTGIDADMNLKMAPADGVPPTIPCRSIAEIRFGPPGHSDAPTLRPSDPPTPRRPLPHPEDIQVVLVNGDTLLGTLEPAEGDLLPVRSESLGVVKLRLESLSEVVFLANRKALPAQKPDTSQGDVAVPVKGGLNFGSVTAIGRAGVEFYSKVFQQAETYTPDQLAAVYFTRLTDPAPEPETLLAIAIAADGSTFRGRIEGFTEGKLRLATFHRAPGPDGKPLVLEIPADRLATIYFKNGDVVYASDLDPVRTDEYPLMIRPVKAPANEPALFKYRRDRSVEGNRLSIRGREFRKGLGVHARSELVYPAAGRFKTFAATVGIDDERGGSGSGVFVVKADGKEIYRGELLHGISSAADLSVPVAGAKEVTLLVEFGDDGGVHAHADWGGARFLK